MNKENLLKLADYLEGPLKAAFDMSLYSDGLSDTVCGSVGCALGHAPYAGINKLETEEWLSFSFRVFDINPAQQLFLFAFHWNVHRNSPVETAKRIRYFVANGMPEGWIKSATRYEWTPPIEQKAPEPKTVYRTVVIDSAVRELQETIGEN